MFKIAARQIVFRTNSAKENAGRKSKFKGRKREKIIRQDIILKLNIKINIKINIALIEGVARSCIL